MERQQQSEQLLLQRQFDLKNQQQYLEVVRRELQANNPGINSRLLQQIIEQYKLQRLNFLYNDLLFISSKSSQGFLQNIVKDVNSNIKCDDSCKLILKCIGKVFVQILAQYCIQICQDQNNCRNSKNSKINYQCIEEAYQLYLSGKNKRNNLQALFK